MGISCNVPTVATSMAFLKSASLIVASSTFIHRGFAYEHRLSLEVFWKHVHNLAKKLQEQCLIHSNLKSRSRKKGKYEQVSFMETVRNLTFWLEDCVFVTVVDRRISWRSLQSFPITKPWLISGFPHRNISMNGQTIGGNIFYTSSVQKLDRCSYICIYIYIHICICVWICMCIYIYIHYVYPDIIFTIFSLHCAHDILTSLQGISSWFSGWPGVTKTFCSNTPSSNSSKESSPGSWGTAQLQKITISNW